MKGKNITFVVGSGAVENAWSPVIRAMNNTLKIKTDDDGANCIFARHIYLLKFYTRVASKGNYQEYLQATKSNILLLKQNICSELKKAQKNGELRPQQEFKTVINKFVSSNIDRTLLVSTNWDEVIDVEINKLFRSNYPTPNSDIQSYHIHGSISSPDELYLPSEITQENYRTEKEEMKIAKNHISLMSSLRESNRTVLYGISLDPLDAELSQTLAAGWLSKNIEEIIIVNPAHKKVANRVKLLLESRYPAKIMGFHPEDLSKRIDYN